MSAVAVIASVVVLIAAVLHVWIWTMESISWTRPATWRRFGVRSQADADTLRPMAYNQGFYNLFLALGAALGLTLYWVGQAEAGTALVLFTMACMLLAAVVLLTTGRRQWRAALVQGTLPLVGFALVALAF